MATKLHDLLNRYLVEHSSRKINFLYWNLADPNDHVLIFVNLKGKDLVRINNEKLIFRVVRIINDEDWSMIRDFLHNYIVDRHDKKAVYLVNVSRLISIVNSVKDVGELKPLDRNEFGTAVIPDDDDDEDIDTINNGDDESVKPNVPICTIDNDVQSCYLIDALYNKYRHIIYNDDQDWKSTDITEAYLNEANIKFNLDAGNIRVPIVDALDVPSKKFVRSIKGTKVLEQIACNEGIINVVSRLTAEDVVVFTSRVYLQFFVNRRRRSHG